jgi:hypothetical protein
MNAPLRLAQPRARPGTAGAGSTHNSASAPRAATKPRASNISSNELRPNRPSCPEQRGRRRQEKPAQDSTNGCQDPLNPQVLGSNPTGRTCSELGRWSDFYHRLRAFIQHGVQRDHDHRLDSSGFNGNSAGVALFHRTGAHWADRCQWKFDPQVRTPQRQAARTHRSPRPPRRGAGAKRLMGGRHAGAQGDSRPPPSGVTSRLVGTKSRCRTRASGHRDHR